MKHSRGKSLETVKQRPPLNNNPLNLSLSV